MVMGLIKRQRESPGDYIFVRKTTKVFPNLHLMTVWYFIPSLLSVSCKSYIVFIHLDPSKCPERLGAWQEEFADYLETLNLEVPQLAKVLEFERAVLATLMDDQTWVVTFDIDPLPMLRALAEGRLPDIAGQPGHFEIEITPDGPISTTGLGLEIV